MTTTRNQLMSRQEAAAFLRVPLTVVDHLIAVGLLTRMRPKQHKDPRTGLPVMNRCVLVQRAEVNELALLPREWLRDA